MSGFDILSDLIKDKKTVYGVLVADLHPADFYIPAGEPFPVITGIVSQIAVTSGVMEIEVDNVRYRCSPQQNNIVDIKPINRISCISFSDDFAGWILAFSRQFMLNAMKGNKPIKIRELLALMSYTAVTLSSEKMSVLQQYYGNVAESSEDLSDRLDMTIFCFAAVFLHLNIVKFVQMSISSDPERTGSSRPAYVLDRFVRLLEEDVQKEHEVAFYADKLGITPHYLTMVTNRYVGMSAGKVIAEALMSKACQYLRNPEYTIQEVAEMLNFSDQSSFGKFFRKHSGTTPASYRKAAR